MDVILTMITLMKTLDCVKVSKRCVMNSDFLSYVQ